MRKRLTIIIGAALALLAALAVYLSCAAYVAQKRAVVQADQLRRAVLTLHPGISTPADVRKIGLGVLELPELAHTSSDCPNSSTAFGAYANNLPQDWISMKLQPLIRRIGRQNWGVSATIQIRDDKVCSIDFQYELARIRQWPLSVSTREYLPEHYRNARPTVSAATGNNDSFWTNFSSDATAQDRARAYDYNFECTNSFRGCASVCKLVPGMWPDYVQFGRDPDPSDLPELLARAAPGCSDTTPR
jgi:hypothetical protein